MDPRRDIHPSHRLALPCHGHNCTLELASTWKWLRKNKPSSLSEPFSESDPEFAEIIQADYLAVAEASYKPTHKHGAQLPTRKQHVLPQKRNVGCIFTVPEKGKTFIFSIVSPQKLKVSIRHIFQNLLNVD